MMRKESGKKAQITVFVFIAVLIVVVVGIFFLARSGEGSFGDKEVSLEVQPVYSHVQECVAQVGGQAIYEIGQTGGYYKSPDLVTSNGVAFYFLDKNMYVPSKREIEKQIGLYVKDKLVDCVDFESFSDFEISSGKIRSEVDIQDEGVVFEVRYSLVVDKGEESYELEDFEAKVPVRLDMVYDIAKEMVEEQETHPESICVSCITNLAEDKDVYVEMNNHDDETIVWIIRDVNSKINDKDLEFRFAQEYK